jgi:hypothetical protein
MWQVWDNVVFQINKTKSDCKLHRKKVFQNVFDEIFFIKKMKKKNINHKASRQVAE